MCFETGQDCIRNAMYKYDFVHTYTVSTLSRNSPVIFLNKITIFKFGTLIVIKIYYQ